MIKYLITFFFGFSFFYLSPVFAEAPLISEISTNTQLNSEANAKLNSEASAQLTEKDIPLNIDVKKNNSESSSTTGRLLMSVLILFVIIFSTYYLVKKYKVSNNINKSNKQIKIISQHYLGPKKSLAIIHVAGESILIGVTDTQISMIKSLSLIDDEIPDNLPKNFSDSLQMENQSQSKKSLVNNRSYQETQKVKEESHFVTATTKEDLDEDFSFSGIKDTVSQKIKSMRSI